MKLDSKKPASSKKRGFTRKKEKEYTQDMSQPVENVEQSLGKILFRNLMGGIAWGIGVTLGATVLLAVIGYFISQANYVPIIGNFVAQIVTFVEENNPRVESFNEMQ